MGTEVHDPSPEARFAGLEVLAEGARVTGGRSGATVDSYVQPMGYRWCYVAVFKDTAMEAAEMTVHMVVGLRGEVADVSVHSGSGPAALDRCVTEHLRYTSFPRAGALVDVTYAVRFVPPGGAAAGKPPAPTTPGTTRWSQRFPQTDPLRFDDLAVDGQGRVVAVGTVTAPVTLDDLSLAPREGATPFLVRLDAQGHAVGGAILDALPHGNAWLLVAAAGEDAVVAGPADDGGSQISIHAPPGAPFVARVGPTGAVRWIRPLPVERVTGLAVAADGAVAFAGILKEPAGTKTSMVARLSADGAPVWQKTLGDLAEPNFHWPATVRGVAVDGEGAVLVAGFVEPWNGIGHLDLGQGSVNPHGESGFVAKFAPDGQVLWSRGITYSESYAVAAGGDTVAVIGDARCGSVERAPFVLAIDDATGSERWARWMPPEPEGRRLSAARVTVATDGAVAFTALGGDELHVVVGSVDRSGAVAWSRVIYPAAKEQAPPPAIVAAPSGLVLLPTRDRPGRDVGRIIGLVK